MFWLDTINPPLYIGKGVGRVKRLLNYSLVTVKPRRCTNAKNAGISLSFDH